MAGFGQVNPATLGVTGEFSGGFNLFDGTPLGLLDAPISEIATSDNFEIGYKGLLGDKLGVMIDLYYVIEKNNSQFTAISPVYRYSGLEDLPANLGSSVLAAVTQPIINSIVASDNGVDDPAVAGAIVAGIAPFIQGGFVAGGDAAINTASPAFGGLSLAQVFAALPFHATISTDQVPANGVTHIAAGYRTFDERDYYGADIGLEYYFDDNLTAFFNYSTVSDIEFMQRVKGNEDAGELPSYLNIPKNKYRMGINYAPEAGLRGSIAFQHDDSYFAGLGQFTGNTEERNLVDASIGYKFDFGLAVDLSATNLMNNEYRYLPNMPRIGRRALLKLRYDFGYNK